jgi:hypothetical protein
MKNVEANLTFGVTPPPVGPPSVPVGLTPDNALSFSNQNVGLDVSALDRGFIKPRPRLSTPAAPCPDAALNAFPEKTAGQNVDAFPQPGSYRWKRGGSYTFTAAGDRPLPFTGFETRLVRNVKVIKDQPNNIVGGNDVGGGGKEFTFETVQPNFQGERLVISSWRVKTDATSATPRELSVNGPNNGDPERGLALEKLQTTDKVGNVVSTFSFPTGVLYLPLPIVPGTQWQAAAVDPTSGETLTLSGQTIKRQQVDACGQVVDGWVVNSTQTFSGAQTQTITYNYVVAPQLGGILIDEHTDTTTSGTAGAHYQLGYTLGQLHPSPLPDTPS